MNDGYEEILVKRQKTPRDTLLKGLIIGAIAVLLAAGVFLFPGSACSPASAAIRFSRRHRRTYARSRRTPSFAGWSGDRCT